MIIRRAHIDRFGILAEQDIAGLSPGLNVFLGRNEAGKSTTMQFFRAMLFGYRRGNRTLDPMPKAKKSAVGGGTLLLLTEAGEKITLTRRPGDKKGGLELFSASGAPLGKEYFDELLGRITVDVFDNVFAFNLKNLMDFSSLNGEDVRLALHGAAFGTGMRSPLQVIKELEQRAFGLLKQDRAGVNALINATVAELEAVEETLAQQGPDLERYGRLQEQLEALEERAACLHKERQVTGRQRASFERRKNLWEKWEALREIQGQLALCEEERLSTAHLGASRKDSRLSFAPDALHRLEAMQEKEATEALRLAQARQALAACSEELRSNRQERTVADASRRPVLLKEQKEARSADASALPGLLQKMEHLAALQEEGLTRLGPEWDLGRVRNADTSLAVNDIINQAMRRMQQHDATREQYRQHVARLQEEHQAALLAVEQLAAKTESVLTGVPDTATYEAFALALGQARAALADVPGLTARAEQAEAQCRRRLSCIDETWTEAELARVDGSLRARREAGNVAESLMAASDAHGAGKERLARLQETVCALEKDLERLQSSEETESVGSVALAEIESSLRGLEHAQHGYLLAKEHVARGEAAVARLDQEAEHFSCEGGRSFSQLARRQPLFIWGGLFCFLAGCALLLTTVAMDFPVGPGTGVGLLLAGGAFCWRGWQEGCRPDPAYHTFFAQKEIYRQTLQEAQEQLAISEEELQKRMIPLAAALPFFPVGAEDLPSALHQGLAEVRARREAELRIQARAQTLKEYQERLDALHEEVAFASAYCTETGRALDDAEKAWEETLRLLGLPTSTRPEFVAVTFDRMDVAQGAVVDKQQAYAALLSTYRSLMLCFDTVVRNVFFAALLDENGTLPILENMRRVLSLLEEGTERYELLRQDDLAQEGVTVAALGQIVNGIGHGMAQVRVMQEARQAEETEARLLNERQEHARQLGQRLARAQEQLDEAQASVRQEQEHWQNWLESFGLARSLSPETALDAVILLAGMQEREKTLHLVADELAEKQKRVLRFMDAVMLSAVDFELTMPEEIYSSWPERTSESFGVNLTNERAKTVISQLFGVVITLLDRLCQLEDEAAQAATRARMLAVREKELAEEAEHVMLAYEQAATGLRQMLDRAGTDDPETFRIRFAAWQQEEDLTRQEQALLSHFQTLAAEEGLSLGALLAEFCDNSREYFAACLTEAQEIAARVEEELTQVAEERGSLLEAQRNLSSGKGSAPLWKRKAYLEDRLNKLVHEWQVYALAKHLLLDAKASFEREGQTGVIGAASEIFSRITEGEYSGITANVSDGAFYAEHRNGEFKDPEKALSQGTKEQLYLALRLAYVQNHASHGEAVPVFMDDILVNFDLGRAGQAARELVRFAAHNQMLFFTCHERTAGLIQEAYAQAGEQTVPLGSFEVTKGEIAPAVFL